MGQYEDSETGLYYNRFRYYSPESGTYISKDPISILGGLNVYVYVKDVNAWVDILGLNALDSILTNPASIWGKSAKDIVNLANDIDGITAVLDGSNKGSKKAQIVKISGHSKITQIQVHPGGGRHSGAYYKISTSTEGKIKVIDTNTYKPDINEKATLYDYKLGKKGNYVNGKWTCK